MSDSGWGERYLYTPSFSQRLLAYLLWPLSLLYCTLAWLRYLSKRPREFGIPVVSVGNLTVGGSGKTPLVTALAQRTSRPAIILRGYGRKSRGLHIVSDGASVQCDVDVSGDEAMLYALKVPHAVVIVSEVRDTAITQARAMGCNAVFLDDGYGKHHIRKLDLVIDVETPNRFCLPSGPYRERLWPGKAVRILRENRDFTREVTLKDATGPLALVTAIARPRRLDPYLPDRVVARHYFPDHHYFDKAALQTILAESGATQLLVTYKDFVKIRPLGLPLALLDLELALDEDLIRAVEQYIGNPG